MVKFANNDRARLCCVSNDATVSICNVLTQPPTLECILRGHTQAVTGNTYRIPSLYSTLYLFWRYKSCYYMHLITFRNIVKLSRLGKKISGRWIIQDIIRKVCITRKWKAIHAIANKLLLAHLTLLWQVRSSGLLTEWKYYVKISTGSQIQVSEDWQLATLTTLTFYSLSFSQSFTTSNKEFTRPSSGSRMN